MHLFFRILPVCVMAGWNLLHWPVEVQAHRSFGLFYQESEIQHLTQDELHRLELAGIRWLMIEEGLPDAQRAAVRDAGFSLLVLVPEYFPIPNRLTNPRHNYFERSDSLLNFYRDDPAVRGLGLFAYGWWLKAGLSDYLENLAWPYLDGRYLFTLDTRPLSGPAMQPFDKIVMLIRSSVQLEAQLSQKPDLAGILYGPDNVQLDLRDFQRVLQILDGQRELPIFFHRDWFMNNTPAGDRPTGADLARITRFYYQVPDARIANPPERRTRYELNWPMLLLFLFWMIYAAYYRLNPLYRKSVGRFFLNYDFFVSDILMRRIRFTSDAAVVFLFSCTISGVMGFSAADLFLNPVSRKALLHYTPLFSSDWNHPAFFFLIFFIAMALILFVQIFWLRVANSRHANTSQIATFVLWPQHLNFVIITAGVIFLRTYSEALLVVTMILVFLAITLLGFFTTAYNMRRIHPTSPLYIATTYALFVLAAVAVISWFAIGINAIQAWQLAVSLSSMHP